jgi:cbb3-type cytochrome c oxidase subunit III
LLKLLSAAGAGVAVAFALAACGTGGIATGAFDEENGRQLFQERCASCHSLAAAGSVSEIGPNLDHAFAQARADGFEESAIREIVHEQIKYPGQFPTAEDDPAFLQGNMPANLVTGEDAEDVAAFVAANAGKDGFAEVMRITSTDGKVIFNGRCASCHILKAAGSKGTTGPNLDLTRPTFERARTQVINGGGVMPAFKGTLTDKQIEAVARYVAENAGK